MKLSSPTNVVFWISVILIILGLLVVLIPSLPLIGGVFLGKVSLGYWLTFAGGILLTLGCLLKGF